MLNNKIELYNTKEEIDNDFWVCIRHPERPLKFNNTENKEKKINTLLSLDEAIKSKYIPNYILSQKYLIHCDADFEKYRQEKYPDFPSRCSSFFVFPNKKTMDKCISFYEWNAISLANVSIDKSKPFKAIKANMELISSYRTYLQHNLKKDRDFFEDYWSGKLYTISYPDNSSYEPIEEIFIEGDVLIKGYYQPE